MNELLLMCYHDIGKPLQRARFSLDEIKRIYYTDYTIVVKCVNGSEYIGDFIVPVEKGKDYENTNKS